MIIGTITVMLIVFGGGGVFSLDAYRSAIEDHVADKNRREQVIELTKRFDSEIKDYNKHIKDHAGTAHALFKDYDAGREDFDGFFKTEDWRRQKMIGRILGTRFRVKDLVTAEESNAVFEQVRQEEAEKNK